MAERLPGSDQDQMIERWRAIADQLAWSTPYEQVLTSRRPRDEWFAGGRLNLSVNCLDRHLDARGDQVAIFWEGEPGDRREVTYRGLHEETVVVAAALRDMGVGVGDRVALHLGWLPEAVVAMLACARIGAEYTVIPVPLPVEALALRLDEFSPRVLFTQDGGWRHGAILPLKARADEALEATSSVEHTIVVRRTGVQVAWFEGDRWYHDVVEQAASSDGAPEAVPSGHLLVAVHMANRRGGPVALRHGTANLGVSALAIHRYGLAEGDVFWCAGDLAWLGAQAHGVFGPLLEGCRTVMYEGTLDVPAPDRAWSIISRYQVTSLLTSPSIVRSLRGWSLTAPAGSTDSLRRVTLLGERLEDDLRSWLTGVVGKHVVVADGWGQVELCGIVAIDLPVAPDQMPNPGFAVLDEQGRCVGTGESGEWVMLGPWAGTMCAVDSAQGDPTASHWTRHPGHYATGDLARYTPSGKVEFLGRIDEVMSVSGQQVSLTEVRGALMEQPFVLDAEVVERTDPRLGRSVAAVVVLHPDAPTDAQTIRDLQDAVRELLGGLSRPRAMLLIDRFGDGLDDATRRKALAALAATFPSDADPKRITWEQVLAAAGR
jgi:acetyl-CoA synthetase